MKLLILAVMIIVVVRHETERKELKLFNESRAKRSRERTERNQE